MDSFAERADEPIPPESPKPHKPDSSSLSKICIADKESVDD